MRLSVIMPVLNEAAGITDALLPLQTLRNHIEVIVVDGGSSDSTSELARGLADQVLTADAGRARQMNAGAAVATGDLLLFLHADTRLPEGFVALVQAAVFGQPPFAARPPLPPKPAPTHPCRSGLDREGGSGGSGGPAAKATSKNTPKPWGRFDVRLAPSSPLLNLVAWMMNQRSRLTGICTGDQAIFVRRELFEQLGGYADIPLMEDIELSRRLRKISRPACLRPALSTSSRKWQKHGVWRTIILMWWIRLQYWAGVKPERLVRQYYTTPGRDGTRPIPATPNQPLGRSSSTSTSSACRPLLIFAKAPMPGQVKTRLIPALGAEGAAQLYERLLRHCLQQTRDWPGQRLLYCAPDSQHPLFRILADEHQLTLRTQQGEDLGQRMANGLADHPQGALLIGTDCPQLSTAHLLQANRALDTSDAAIIPSEDGGYVLIGQRTPNPAPFLDMHWSHAEVMQDTRMRLQQAGLSLWEGPALWDLDEPKDLPRLKTVIQDL